MTEREAALNRKIQDLQEHIDFFRRELFKIAGGCDCPNMVADKALKGVCLEDVPCQTC